MSSRLLSLRRPLPFALLVAAAALFAPRAIAQVPAAPIRVMSYNIHHGEGTDGKLDVERIAALILEQKADLVALQEVDRGVERTARRDLPAELARLTGLTVYFDRNIIHQGGDYGNAVLTKFPIKQAKNTPLKKFGDGEQRGVIQLVLDVHGREVLFMNTHFDQRREDAERVSSAEEARQIVRGAGKMPVIFCGDFNDKPGSQMHAAIKTFLTDSWELVGHGNGFTVPTQKPNKRIDYVWVSATTVEPVRIEVLKSIASDHLPVIAELRLK